MADSALGERPTGGPDPAPAAAGGILAGKRGLVMGVANDRSIAWGIARAAAGEGAELAFSYQGETFERRVRPLAEGLGSTQVHSCDVEDEAEIASLFGRLGETWDGLDFVVHALAFSDKNELKGRYLDTSRENFRRTMAISAYSFTAIARHAAPMLREGGSLLTLTYLGSTSVTPNYNVMGVAKAALEASVRYLAADLGSRGIRVNAISAGPMRTLAGSAIADARFTYRWTQKQSPLRRAVEFEEVGNAGLYLLSDLSAGVTGEVLFVDCGYSIVGVPSPRHMERPED